MINSSMKSTECMMTMTYKYDETTQCSGKFKFPTKQIAESTFPRKHGIDLMAYECPFCGFHHIGHKPSKVHKFVKGKKNV